MVDTFGATSTTEDVLSGVKLHGKRILVTGVSAGLGVETARVSGCARRARSRYGARLEQGDKPPPNRCAKTLPPMAEISNWLSST